MANKQVVVGNVTFDANKDYQVVHRKKVEKCYLIR